MRVDQIPQFDSASNTAVKLLRTFTMQVETLAKLQRGGEQVVKVVHVHSGAQAVVGNVINGATGAQGVGVPDETRNQPHATGQLLTDDATRLPKVRSEDADRISLPVASRAG
jgi:hypothetical protein